MEYDLYEREQDERSGVRYSSRLRVLVDGSLGERVGLSGQLDDIGFSHSSNNLRDGLDIDLTKYVPFLNQFAFRHRGTEQGDTSLLVLEMLSKRRVAFDFLDTGVQQCTYQRFIGGTKNCRFSPERNIAIPCH